MRVAINGFGRIGRAIYRANNSNPKLDIVVINDANPDKKNIFYTLKYDTLYGTLDDIKLDGDYIHNEKSNLKLPKFFLNVMILKFLKFEFSSKFIVRQASFVTDLPNKDDKNSGFLNRSKIKGTSKENRKR